MTQTTSATAVPVQREAPALDRRLVALGSVVVLGAIMSILDATIVNVAMRTIGRDLHASIATIQWVITGYLLGFATVIPAIGWAAQRFGAKRVFIGAVVLFAVSSALAGSAVSVGELIAFRVLQGVGGGMILPVGQLIVAQAAGPKRMGRVMSVLGVPMLLGSMTGPVIGGLIVSGTSWRWIFFINPPVALVAVVLAVRLLPSGRGGADGAAGGRLDLLGLVLLCGGIGSITYGMSQASTRGFGASPPLTLIGAGAALVAGYALHALRLKERALIDVTLFRHRGFAVSMAANLMVGIALFGALVLLPLYWQIVRGASPLATGLLLTPQALGAAAALPLAGKVTDRAGPAFVVPAGIALGLGGLAAYTQTGTGTPYAVLAAALFVLGLGLGATFVPLMAAAYRDLPRAAIPSVTSAFNTVQRIGGSIGTALLAVTLQEAMTRHAPSHAFDSAFWVACALTAAALIPALLLPKGTQS
ncbi:MAG TPA: MDR family MFS transporter [Streptosporangiaceae bacterium]